MVELGFNYRLTDFQSALGLSQLKKIDSFVRKRRKIAKLYDKEFKNTPFIETIKIPNKYKSAYHLYNLKIDFKKAKISKNIFLKKLFKKGLDYKSTIFPFIDIFTIKKNFKLNLTKFPSTERFYEKIISLPIFYDFSLKNQLIVIKTIKKNFISKIVN